VPQSKQFEIVTIKEITMKMGRRNKYPRLGWGLYEAIDRWINTTATRDEITLGVSKNALYLSMISILLLFLVSCVPQQSKLAAADNLTDFERAQYVLLDFLRNLHNGKYDEAARLYNGSYQTMIDHNPNIDPNDHTALLRKACTLNGMQCLQAKIVGLEESVSNEKYVFIVEFLKHNGTLFMLEPCCGENNPNFPPQSVFLFTVIKGDQNQFTVKDMPPYAP
jgi:hypothetical protein